MLRRALTPLIVLAIIAGACAGSDGAEGTDDTPTAPRRTGPDATILPPADPDGLSSTAPTPEVLENNDDGRIVVETADGQLFTLLPTGEDRVDLTDPGTTNSQAAWAPDGSRIAWVQHADATGETAIALDRFDRSDLHTVAVSEAPSYLYWDPSASRIAHLRRGEVGIDLSVTEPFAEDGPTTRRIDRGEPYFLSWGPSGTEMLVHASEFRLDQIDLGSATIIIDEFPARFGAAFWMPDDTLVFADSEGDQQFLVTTGASGEGRRPLTTYDGDLRFAVSNEGNRIAMQASPADDDDPVVTASTERQIPDTSLAFQEPEPTRDFDDSLDAIDPLELGIPYVMGTFGGEPFALSIEPAIGLFPSPDGQAVAWFEQVPDISGVLALRVDYGGTIFTTRPFIPSEVFGGDYLPYFDQYEQSHDFWSPSSDLFVYAGRSPGDATDHIWMFDRTTGDVTELTEGVVASFTHTPQAAGAASSL